MLVVYHCTTFEQAHLKADNYYSVVANMRGNNAEEVAQKILHSEELRGLQVCGPDRSSSRSTRKHRSMLPTIGVARRKV